MSTIYRGSKLGDSLVEALDVLVNQGKISSSLAVEVLAKFDDAMVRTLEKKVNSKGSLRGKLDVYRYIDNVSFENYCISFLHLCIHLCTLFLTTSKNKASCIPSSFLYVVFLFYSLLQVWTFVMSNATLKVAPTLSSSKKDEEEIECEGMIKIVVVDSKLVKASPS
jgi:hypothetical protein